MHYSLVQHGFHTFLDSEFTMNSFAVQKVSGILTNAQQSWHIFSCQNLRQWKIKDIFSLLNATKNVIYKRYVERKYPNTIYIDERICSTEVAVLCSLCVGSMTLVCPAMMLLLFYHSIGLALFGIFEYLQEHMSPTTSTSLRICNKRKSHKHRLTVKNCYYPSVYLYLIPDAMPVTQFKCRKVRCEKCHISHLVKHLLGVGSRQTEPHSSACNFGGREAHANPRNASLG